MAARRMSARSVVNSDRFLDLDSDSKCLYFALLGAADDDGFVDGVRGIARSWGLGTGAVEALVQAGYLLRFDDVMVIVHWNQHNYVPKDRYRPTVYTELRKQLVLNEQREYERIAGGETPTFSSENSLYTQDRTEENKTIQSNISHCATHDGGEEAPVLSGGDAAQKRGTAVLPILGVAPSLQRQRLYRQLDAVSKRIVTGEALPDDADTYRRLFRQLSCTS